jgi:hypothetical protein
VPVYNQPAGCIGISRSFLSKFSHHSGRMGNLKAGMELLEVLKRKKSMVAVLLSLKKIKIVYSKFLTGR